MYTIFMFPVQTDRRGSGPSARCLYNICTLNRDYKNRGSSTTREYLQPWERANSIISPTQGRDCRGLSLAFSG
jgi:hypothetical protein